MVLSQFFLLKYEVVRFSLNSTEGFNSQIKIASKTSVDDIIFMVCRFIVLFWLCCVQIPPKMKSL